MSKTAPHDTAATEQRGHGFGTAPVFLAGISTILGAIMFLRFGYAVGHVGLLGALAIILLGHLVTIPTAMALAEIATNRKVEGGGEYFIISRSFGTTIGSVIGISLYLSQAVSVAFYMIAFAESFTPLAGAFEQTFGFPFDPRIVSLPGTVALIVLMLTKGADMGVRALYVVVSVLAVALVLFFLGDPLPGFSPEQVSLTDRVANADPFMIVFAICFPAFTGMTAGVGLSGDLANPRRSIPAGTMAATLTGMVVYVFIVIKLAFSAPPEALAENQLIMAEIALWGPIIPIGLACATLSSAIGSILVAPRTLQALGSDASLPWGKLNPWLAQGVGKVNEPRNATLVTAGIALVIVALGNVDFVARIISMFFMVTYGSLCAISFLEHFAARPSYRPSFRSRWYISLFGALMCLFLMFQMDPLYAVLSIVIMVGLYRIIRARADHQDDLAEMFEGVMTQLTRYLHLRLQTRKERSRQEDWRPSVIMVNQRTFDRRAPLALLRWICHRYGFGTYLHFIQGHLNPESYRESLRIKSKLIEMARVQKSPVYMDTIISPSMISALAQSLQVPGVSGLQNNTAMFEFSIHDPPEVITEVVKSSTFAATTRMTLLVLRHGDHMFGERRNLHIWLTWNDGDNANVMILLSYILLGHPDWKDAEISVFAALPRDRIEELRTRFETLIEEGRLPISNKNIRFLPTDNLNSFRRLVEKYSSEADLTVLGFDMRGLNERKEALFTNHPYLRDVLFVHAPHEIEIT
ncbi:MAG: Na-K-Cl cotransporter [Rhodothermaceae bacterium]|nr:MAG: Na-K-Cl cotransporter [Rhodothermaceae bacterium]